MPGRRSSQKKIRSRASDHELSQHHRYQEARTEEKLCRGKGRLQESHNLDMIILTSALGQCTRCSPRLEAVRNVKQSRYQVVCICVLEGKLTALAHHSQHRASAVTKFVTWGNVPRREAQDCYLTPQSWHSHRNASDRRMSMIMAV